MKDLVQLKSMGFAEGEVVEIILTTLSEDEQPNAAPMGVWVQSGLQLIIRPFLETQTAQNIAQLGEAIINITSNPYAFLVTAFKHELPHLKSLDYEKGVKVKPPRLAGMTGYLEVTLTPHKNEEFNMRFKEFSCNIQHAEIISPFPVVHSRARCAAIECIIHATRIRALHKTNLETTQLLMNRIEELQELVTRIAPLSPSAEVIHQLMSILPQWTR